MSVDGQPVDEKERVQKLPVVSADLLVLIWLLSIGISPRLSR